jgi:pilus assembly protein Flp/PilA
VLKHFGSLRRKQLGVTATEYGVILALVAVAIVLVVTTLGTNISNLFSSASGAI